MLQKYKVGRTDFSELTSEEVFGEEKSSRKEEVPRKTGQGKEFKSKELKPAMSPRRGSKQDASVKV